MQKNIVSVSTTSGVGARLMIQESSLKHPCSLMTVTVAFVASTFSMAQHCVSHVSMAICDGKALHTYIQSSVRVSCVSTHME